jgi:hypothetical protein
MLTDIERYTHGVALCRSNAELSRHIEIRQLWLSIASSYASLLAREKRIADEEVAGGASRFSGLVAGFENSPGLI